MKLCEFLENTSYKYIKIGTCGGDAFMYCGDVENLDTKRIDRKYRDCFKKRYKTHLENYNKYKKDGINIKKTIHDHNIKKIVRYGREMTTEEYTNLMIEQEENLYKKYERRIKEYKQLAKREIKEAYNSILYADCIVVIVSGCERGNVGDLFEEEKYGINRGSKQ